MLKYYYSKLMRKIFLPAAIGGSKIHPTARVASLCSVLNSELGKYTYIGEGTTLNTTKVGNFTSIGGKCTIGGGHHPLEWVSTSPVFNAYKSPLGVRFAEHTFSPYKETVIGNDVWIGIGCFIRSGVTIGDGAVIGMGSVVTKDVGPYEIWAGNPARMIRRRFPEDVAQKLCASDWFHWEDEKIKRYAGKFTDPAAFLESLEEDF